MDSWRKSMHTVELYERVKGLADSMGYQVREENLGGIGGGACEVAGRRCVFIDLSLSSTEQLEQLVEALRGDEIIHTVELPDELVSLFSLPLGRAA